MPPPAAAPHLKGPACKAHPKEAAAWVCDWCGANLCPDCAAQKPAGTDFLTVCLPCGGPARVLTRPRASVSFLSRIPAAFTFPFSGQAIFFLVGTAIVTWVLSFGPRLLVVGTVWAVFFSVLRASAVGAADLVPDFSNVWDDIAVPGLRGILVVLLVVLALVLPGFVPGHSAGLMVLSISVAAFCVPMMLIISATNGSPLQMVNPVLLVGYAWRLGFDYFVAVVVTAGSLIGLSLSGAVANFVARFPLPILPALAAQCVTLYMPFVLARILGTLVFCRGADLGFGVAQQYEDPVLPGAVPRGKLKAQLAAETAAPAAADGVGADHTPFQLAAIELDEPGASDPGAPIVQALELKNLERAIALYVTVEAGVLTPRVHFDVARAAASKNDYALALKAFKAAATVKPEDPLAPRALVLMARIYGERLNDAASAERIYRHVAQKFAGSEDAKFAEQKLAAMPRA